MGGGRANAGSDAEAVSPLNCDAWSERPNAYGRERVSGDADTRSQSTLHLSSDGNAPRVVARENGSRETNDEFTLPTGWVQTGC